MMLTRPIVKKAGGHRFGKGFSRTELKQSGLDCKEALRLRLPVDLRRKTAHQENVEALKTLLKSKRSRTGSKKKPKS